MKKDSLLKGKFQAILRWPLYLGVLYALLCVVLFFVDRRAFGIAVVFLVAYIALAMFLTHLLRKNLSGELIRFATAFGREEGDAIADYVLPMAILDEDDVVIYGNEAFQRMIGEDKILGEPLADAFPDIALEDPEEEEGALEGTCRYRGIPYRMVLQHVDPQKIRIGQDLLDVEEEDVLSIVTFFDESRLHELERINEENKIVAGIIAIDNYDEAIESMEEVRRSLLLALIDRKVSQYFAQYDGLVKKFEKEHYIFVMRKTKFEEMRDAKFPLQEEVGDVKVGNEIAITISMGIGLNQGSFVKDLDAAQASIDMALSRGGDQVIVRDNEKVSFYGGHTDAVEKYTRVKARVKAHALREIILAKDRVVIMGHKITDVDTLGAAIGIYRAATTLGKPAHIVIDRSSTSIQPIVEDILSDEHHEDSLFVSGDEAKELVNADTVVVVVDTNRPNYTECRDLLYKTEAIVVLDHHRQGEEVIKDARLSYIEPYASSASEMVTEVLQYFDEEVRLRSTEANCMYAGIMVDTNNFHTRCGVRTFEAAAYLRRMGADITHVRKLFRESIEDYRAKAKAIQDAELFMDAYAITVCPAEGLASPTIVCSQTANELLGVIGVKASFVLTEYNDLVYVSARAIDEVNVQLIMERLGGGGHINMAGTQFENRTVDEVKKLLKQTLREMTAEGDIG